MFKFLLSDFHGTIVDSNNAWLKAFYELRCNNLDLIKQLIYQKKSRKQIAIDNNIDYNLLLQTYRKNLTIRYDVVNLINKIHGNKNIIILSNSSREKLLLDIKQIKDLHNLEFSYIYTSINNTKNDINFLKKIINKHNIKKAYMIGNDIREDFINLNEIINIFIPYKETIIFNEKI